MKGLSKRKQLLIAVLIAAVILMSVVFAAVYSNKRVKNSFIPAALSVSVIENEQETGLTNSLPLVNGSAEKRVQVKNSGKTANAADEYVRVCIFPKFINKANEDIEIYVPYNMPESISGSFFSMGDVKFTLNRDWEKNWNYADGYFYFNDVLSPGAVTPTLIENVSVDSDKLDYYINKGALLRVSVLTDAIQTVGGAVEDRWKSSKLDSNDVERPNTKYTTTYYFAADDKTASPAAVQVSEYELARARKMITSLFVPVYITQENAEENIEEDLEEYKDENSENSADIIESTEVLEAADVLENIIFDDVCQMPQEAEAAAE